jgi:hypothetical protein
MNVASFSNYPFNDVPMGHIEKFEYTIVDPVVATKNIEIVKKERRPIS